MKTKDIVTVVNHHPDASAEQAIRGALREVKRKAKEIIIQAVATILWSWVAVMLVLWPPIYYAMIPEARGAVWMAAGVCGVISFCAIGRALYYLTLIRTQDSRQAGWYYEDDLALLPPVMAWREES